MLFIVICKECNHFIYITYENHKIGDKVGCKECGVKFNLTKKIIDEAHFVKEKVQVSNQHIKFGGMCIIIAGTLGIYASALLFYINSIEDLQKIKDSFLHLKRIAPLSYVFLILGGLFLSSFFEKSKKTKNIKKI